MASMLSTRALRSTVACSTCRSLAVPSAATATATRSAMLLPRRGLSTSPDQPPTDYTDKPRWSYTPPRAKAPFSLRFNSKRREYPVNADPKVLDQFYVRMLGADGDKVLSDEIKWLAVTHKSFDQGRRGFNDRLAFLGMFVPYSLYSYVLCHHSQNLPGKRIVQLQASLALVQSSEAANTPAKADPHGRTPFSHPALDGLRSLSPETKSFWTDRTKLSELAQKYEMQNVLRWTPRKVGISPSYLLPHARAVG